ncbi:MAG: beta-lactamase family protein [Acidobacteriia bacterium]|nr:beta-lactamase family protein [Terriglobia bacterium]
MKTILFLIPLLLQAGVADNPDVKGSERLFEAWLSGQMAYRNLPGVAVGVVYDQELVWAKGFGLADLAAKSPVTPATKFRMASHSKLFTATSIMQLRDAGILRLDDPVSRYLPWFKAQRAPSAPPNPETRELPPADGNSVLRVSEAKPAEGDDTEVTIEALLTHGSGLSREAGSHWSDFNFPTAAEVRAYLASNRAIYPPGVRFKYSNLGFTIAAMVVEAVSGEPFAAYVAKHIFDPLGMSSSSIDRPVEGMAIGYGRRMPDGSRETFPFVDARAMAGATGVTSTVEDMAKFVSSQFNARILSKGALRQMHRVRFVDATWTSGYAIGFSVSRVDGKVWIGHGGSYPGYKTHTYIQMEENLGVIVLTNGDDSEPSAIATQLRETVGAAVAKSTTAPPQKPVWDASWTRFAGVYRSRSGDVHVVELNQQLVTIDPTTPKVTPARLVPLGDGTFRLESASGGLPVGEIVRFEQQNGRVVRIYTGGSYRDRVPE